MSISVIDQDLIYYFSLHDAGIYIIQKFLFQFSKVCSVKYHQ